MSAFKKQKVRFSAADDEQLIEIVSGYPILWEMKLQEFKNVVKKDTIWKEMDKMLNKPDGQCKSRWKSIRDHYKRQKKLEKNSPTGSAASKKRALYWDRLRFLDSVEDERGTQSNFQSDELTDVDQEALNNDGQCTAGDEQETTETNDATATEEPLTENAIKRRRELSMSRKSDKISSPPREKTRTNDPLLHLIKNKEQERQELGKYVDQIINCNDENEIDLFFRSLAATVKKFEPEDITEAKMKIFNVVTEIEIRNQRAKRNSRATFDENSNRPNSASSSTFCDTNRHRSAFSSHSHTSVEQSSDSNMFMMSPVSNTNLSENALFVNTSSSSPFQFQDERSASLMSPPSNMNLAEKTSLTNISTPVQVKNSSILTNFYEKSLQIIGDYDQFET